MELRPEEISKIIRSQIKNYDVKINQSETGVVALVGDGIARAAGLENCMVNELLEFPTGVFGMAQNLEENSVSIVMLGPDEGIKEGDTVKRTGRVVSVPVGEKLLGRVVNALGQPIDEQGPIEADTYAPIESPAPGILVRKSVDTPLQTGIKAIDRKDDNRHRYYHQPEGQRRYLHLCRHRSETVYSSPAGRKSAGCRRHGLHDSRIRYGI